MTTTRRLAAILAADVAGYSRLMAADEVGTLAALKAARREVVDPSIAEHKGRIVKTTGDGMLVEFASAVDAVTCAMAVQEKMAVRGGALVFRIGINVGDIIIDGDDIFGDGVNVAARIENECEPGGVYLAANALEQIRNKTQFHFDDLGEKALKNIDRPIRVYAMRAATSVPSAVVPPEPGKPLPLPDKPSIAVLPFQNMSGDPEQEYFADGIVEDIITALSRFKSLFVIARNSSFTYKGKAVDIKHVGRELGVRYVLEGSIRKASGRVRITGQLIEAATGAHVWAERYDRDLLDIFAAQDEITEAVAIAIEPAVMQVEQQRAARKPPESLGSWEAYQRGLWHSGRIGTTENDAAKAFFRQAIDLDPNFASAHAELANAILREAWLYQTRSMADVLDEAFSVAQKAISLDPQDVVAHNSASIAWFQRGDHESAVAAARQALVISPNYSAAHQTLGSTLVFSGQPREGIDALRTSMRLNPNDPSRHVRLVHISMGHYFLREYDAAVEFAKEAVRSSPGIGIRSLAAALGQIGRLDDAKQALQRAIAAAPKSFDMYVRHRAPWFRPEDHRHVLEGLRKAGWEG